MPRKTANSDSAQSDKTEPVPFDDALRRLLKAKPQHKPAKKSGEGGAPAKRKAKPSKRAS